MQNTDDPPGHLNPESELLDIKWKLIRKHIININIYIYSVPTEPGWLSARASIKWLEDYFKI